MENLQTPEHLQHIKGWGVDADPRNEPTYPMKHYTGDDHQRLNYERPQPQQETVEVLHSIERPGLSAVYGTPLPPSGLSGNIRRFAFRFSEDRFPHWLGLILADRVDVVEGLAADFRQGHIPNFFKEMGYGAIWKHNKKGLLARMALGVGAAVAIAVLMNRKK